VKWGLDECLMCGGAGDIDGATGLIQRCLTVDQTSSDAHILMARVGLRICKT